VSSFLKAIILPIHFLWAFQSEMDEKARIHPFQRHSRLSSISPPSEAHFSTSLPASKDVLNQPIHGDKEIVYYWEPYVGFWKIPEM
jgi:hypothetical protein